MSKYEFIKTQHIVPVKKTYKWTYEVGYNGESKSLDINVYPYTVEEKLELQTATKQAQLKLKNSEITIKEQGGRELQEVADRSALYILKKEDETITIEQIQKMPAEVKTDLMYLALEFEGFKRDDLEGQSKKVVDEFQK